MSLSLRNNQRTLVEAVFGLYEKVVDRITPEFGFFRSIFCTRRRPFVRLCWFESGCKYIHFRDLPHDQFGAQAYSCRT
jgi:hypothetical protein